MNSEGVGLIHDINWVNIEHLIEILKHFDRVIQELQSGTRPSYAEGMGYVYKLSNIIYRIIDLNPMANNFYLRLKERMGQVTENQAYSMFFVRQFKKLDFIDLNLRERVMGRIREMMPSNC